LLGKLDSFLNLPCKVEIAKVFGCTICLWSLFYTVVSNKGFAKLKLGIYYFRKSVSRFSENNQVLKHNLLSYQFLYRFFRKKKSKEKIFSFQKYA